MNGNRSSSANGRCAGVSSLANAVRLGTLDGKGTGMAKIGEERAEPEETEPTICIRGYAAEWLAPDSLELVLPGRIDVVWFKSQDFHRHRLEGSVACIKSEVYPGLFSFYPRL